MILPGRYMRRHRRPGHDYGEAFLHDIRFDEHGHRAPDFALNNAGLSAAKILVTDIDFGCGSSREGAAFAVHGLRFARAGRAELRRDIPGQLHPERSAGRHARRSRSARYLAAAARAARRGQ